MVVILILILPFFLGVIGDPFGTIQKLDGYRSMGASCIDGSAPAYYIYPGSGDGSNKWFLFFQGGGWCTSLGDCYNRSLTFLGSSTTYTETMEFSSQGGYFLSDPVANPSFYNWNRVVFAYCDGGSFSGNSDTPYYYSGNALYFRGYRNLQAYYDHLSKNFGLLSGTDFVIAGCSAGGLATYLHVDWWKDRLPVGSRVHGLPDSGYFLDFDSDSGPKYSTDMKWVFKTMNATEGVNKNCVLANPMNPELCFFAEHTVNHVETPLFPLQSRFDGWQILEILGSQSIEEINRFGDLFVERFNAVFENTRNGCFLESCWHHCWAYNEVSIDGLLSGQAIYKWLNEADKGIHKQIEPFPCSSCCKPN